MGWTGVRREPGMTDREFFEREFPVTLTQTGRILDCATVRGVFYAAVKGSHQGAGQVWAMVVLIRRTRSDGGVDAWVNFHHKELTETSGLGDFRCPSRVLDCLDELPECAHPEPGPGQVNLCSACCAREWRRRCREVAGRQARAAGVRPGARVRFARPVKFASGDECREFEFVARSTFRALEGSKRYRITDWRAMDFEVVI
jgi:hypothetical protein